MASLPLTAPSHQRQLHLGDTHDNDATGVRDNLSGLAGRDDWLWLAGDEGCRLLRLQANSHDSWLKLADFGLAGGKDDGESDLEGLALDGQRLWLVGSHSLRRRRHNTTKGEPLALEPQRNANGQVLGCLHLDAAGRPRSGQRLRFNHHSGDDALTAELASQPLLQPFLAIPSKDNGLDIEGITVCGNRVLLGLRGPVLRGIALVADLRLAGLDDGDTSNACGNPLQLTSLNLHYLDLGGLAVRDLAVVPGSNDVLILAGPTMTLAGPCLLYHWREVFSSTPKKEIKVQEPKALLWLRDGGPDAGHNKPEGLDLTWNNGDLIAWIAYDNPDKHRCRGTGCCTHLDGYVLPRGVG